MNTDVAGIISIIVFQILIGMSPFLYKLIHADIPSALVVAIRWGLGAMVLLLWFALTRGWKKLIGIRTWKQVVGVVFLGVFGSGIASLWNLVAVRNIGVVLSSLLVNLELPLGVFLGVVLLGEKLTSVYFKSALVLLAGFLLLTVNNGIVLPLGGSYLFGVLFALGAAVIWGSCTLVGKKLTASLAPSVVSFWRLLLGTVTNSVFVLGSGYTLSAASQSIFPSDWKYLIFLGVVTSGIGFVLYYKALKVLSIHKISLLFTISPIVSVLLGVATGEKPLLSQWVGIVLILIGMAYVFVKKGAL